MMTKSETENEIFEYKAETQQLLNILIHSLYSDRDVFLRELISNAADALTKFHFKSLTTSDIRSPEAELGIWIKPVPDQNLLIIRDTGIGMSRQEMIENLGTIAHSGAASFLEQMKQTSPADIQNIIGQFGVGFYAAFMVADTIEVISTSWDPKEAPSIWTSHGEKNFTIAEAGKQERGTEILLHLKEDAKEYTDTARLKQIIKKHSNFIPYPIYLDEESDAVNEQTAIWRQTPSTVTEETINDFYSQYTLDFSEPLESIHLTIDAPLQLYALLFIPSTTYNPSFSLRKQDGLQLYCRNILLQEFSRDLLPDYLRFVQGVVDSEDIPINVSRETIQSNRVVTQIRKILTAKVLDKLAELAKSNAEKYITFWKTYGDFLKEGISTHPEDQEKLTQLIRFNTYKHPENLLSFEDYLAEKAENQQKIYYYLDSEANQMAASPHMDLFKKYNFDVIHFKSVIDPFMVLRIPKYQDMELVNVANPKSLEEIEALQTQEEKDSDTQDAASTETAAILSLFKNTLNDRIKEVRASRALVDSPVRITLAEGSLPQELQSAYRIMNQELPESEKVLEVNLKHPIIKKLPTLSDAALQQEIIEYLYETGLLLEGSAVNQATYSRRYLDILGKLL